MYKSINIIIFIYIYMYIDGNLKSPPPMPLKPRILKKNVFFDPSAGTMSRPYFPETWRHWGGIPLDLHGM